MSLDAVSILLPVYNWPLGDFVADLHRQAAAEPDFSFEILVFDDASPDLTHRAKNRAALAALPHVQYRELPHNVGRAAIRNQLARAARHPWLLLLDGDSSLPDAQFIRRYRQVVASSPATPVWIGGTVYAATPPADPTLRLRWTYGRAREQRPASSRQRTPYAAFTLNNLLIRADLYAGIGLREDLGRTYGHEDTSFGGALAVQQTAIGHLDNPVLHIGLEPAAIFRRKTAEAVENLVHLARTHQPGALDSALWRYTHWLTRWWLAGLTKTFLTMMEPQLVKNLDSAHPSLHAFDLWRLLLALRSNTPIASRR